MIQSLDQCSKTKTPLKQRPHRRHRAVALGVSTQPGSLTRFHFKVLGVRVISVTHVTAKVRSHGNVLQHHQGRVLKIQTRDFSGNPVVQTSASNAAGVGQIPGQGAKFPHDPLTIKPKHKLQKQYHNQFNKDLKNGPQQKKKKNSNNNNYNIS